MNKNIKFVSAGAGSGKTHRLTEILLDQLSRGKAKPAGVIAVTFTKKAAAELRERVRSFLLSNNEWDLANSIGQARIGTVHSVCGIMLKRYAFEMGLSTEQSILEEEKAAQILNKARDMAVSPGDIAKMVELAGMLGKDKWQDDLKKLVDHARANGITAQGLKESRDECAKTLLVNFPAPTSDDLDQLLLAAMKTYIPRIEKAQDHTDKTANYLQAAKNLKRMIESESYSWRDWIALSKSKPAKDLVPMADNMNDIAARVTEHPRFKPSIQEYLDAIFDLCGKTLDKYESLKTEAGQLDFTDLEMKMLSALNIPAVMDDLKSGLDLLLVDEYQDTNPIQLALFMKLAECAKQTYWVGDVKQSIYGFRGSDTQLMTSIVGALPKSAVERLPKSWRSRPELVGFVNSVFKDAFDGLQSYDIELTPTRTDKSSHPALMNWILEGKNINDQCKAIGRGILELTGSGYQVFDKREKIHRPVRYGDIAILCKSNDRINEVAVNLNACAVPTMTSQSGLTSTPEAALAMACLRRLNDTSDTIATAEIISLADSEEPEKWLEDRLQYLASKGAPDDWREKGANPHPILATLVAIRDKLALISPKEALREIVAACFVPGRVLRWKQDPESGRIRLANLEALIAMASTYEDVCRSGQHAASISGFLLWIGEQAAQGNDKKALPAINAVSVLTRHSAKGLEWPVVILMDLEHEIKDRLWDATALSKGQFDMSDPLKGRYIHYWPWPFGAQEKVSQVDNISATKIAKMFQKMAKDEEIRLWYVSMTRARDLLIMAWNGKIKKTDIVKTEIAKFLMGGDYDDCVETKSGEKIKICRQAVKPLTDAEIQAPAPRDVFWFKDGKLVQRMPLYLNPAEAPALPASIINRDKIGKRLVLSGNPDMTEMGNAIHACIALAFTDPDAPITAEEISAILKNHGMEGKIKPNDVLEQIGEFIKWIASRWQGAKPMAEIPVEASMENGQVISGRIDLLVDTGGGYALIDHKSFPGKVDMWEEKVKEYSGQLDAYCKAVKKATGKDVSETWIFFPVAGGAAQISI